MEEIVFNQMPEYHKTDLAAILVCLVRLNYYPVKVLRQINLQQTLANFNKEDCLRILDTLTRHAENHTEHKELNDELLEKLWNQAIALSGQMDDRNLTRALSVLSLTAPSQSKEK